VSRYREELQLHEKFQAMKNAVIGTGPSIITSALTLAVATIAVGIIAKVKMIGQFATMIGRGTLISFVCIVFALPATLLICDFIIKHTTIGWKESDGKVQSISENNANSTKIDI
jgi:predicted RND superfamily exporter protein